MPETDPSTWPFGPRETVVGDWIDNVSGYRCLVFVGPLGQLNGYVEVPADHAWFGKGYDDLEPYPDVHGGVTYAGTGEGFPITDTGWWFGFDTAHLGDFVPGASRADSDEVLRGPEYVAAEASKLAHQLAAMAK